jgi:pilus assembly protein CpaE
VFKSLLLRTASGISLAKNEMPALEISALKKTPVRTVEPIEKVDRTPAVYGIIGAKGGVGATTIAINLSVALSRDFAPTTLVDANLQQPDAAVLLGQTTKVSISELVQRQAEIDKELLQACSSSVAGAPNCSLLAPLADGSSALSTDLSQISECLLAAKSLSPFWVLDLPQHLDKHLVEIMDKCNKVILVLEPTMASIASANRWLTIFTELGYGESKVLCVLNRSGGKHSAVEEQLRSFPQFAHAVRVPNAYSFLEKCSNEGEPAVLKNRRDIFSQSVFNLAKSLAESGQHV